jgi:hypothetical protein
MNFKNLQTGFIMLVGISTLGFMAGSMLSNLTGSAMVGYGLWSITVVIGIVRMAKFAMFKGDLP